jgi:hypothetical protein
MASSYVYAGGGRLGLLPPAFPYGSFEPANPAQGLNTLLHHLPSAATALTSSRVRTRSSSLSASLLAITTSWITSP